MNEDREKAKARLEAAAKIIQTENKFDSFAVEGPKGWSEGGRWGVRFDLGSDNRYVEIRREDPFDANTDARQAALAQHLRDELDKLTPLKL